MIQDWWSGVHSSSKLVYLATQAHFPFPRSLKPQNDAQNKAHLSCQFTAVPLSSIPIPFFKPKGSFLALTSCLHRSYFLFCGMRDRTNVGCDLGPRPYGTLHEIVPLQGASNGVGFWSAYKPSQWSMCLVQDLNIMSRMWGYSIYRCCCLY